MTAERGEGARTGYPPAPSTGGSGTVGEVFTAFLRLGLTSFGGPVAHLSYFRAEFVGRRRWLDEATYADLVAVSQFLPGPSNSQVGLALGMSRAGLAGGLAAWCGFTLPSALALTRTTNNTSICTKDRAASPIPTGTASNRSGIPMRFILTCISAIATTGAAVASCSARDVVGLRRMSAASVPAIAAVVVQAVVHRVPVVEPKQP